MIRSRCFEKETILSAVFHWDLKETVRKTFDRNGGLSALKCIGNLSGKGISNLSANHLLKGVP